MYVGLVSENQYESLIELLCEVHAYYNDGSVISQDMVREHLYENLLSEKSPHHLIVATNDDDKVVGLAAITLVYSLVDFAADQRKHCQLKELYVSSSARSKGIGKALMAWVARYAYDRDCRRIDWPVRTWNTRGISFYERLGAKRVVDRISYRLSGPCISQLAFEANSSFNAGDQGRRSI